MSNYCSIYFSVIEKGVMADRIVEVLRGRRKSPSHYIPQHILNVQRFCKSHLHNTLELPAQSNTNAISFAMSSSNDSVKVITTTECYYNCMDYPDYVDFIEDYIYPKWYEWVFIAMHIVVFIFGLTGNLLVCIAVYRNRSMRTVTNYFIVNLAVADFLVILICLPPTVLWDVTETWFFGTATCRIVLYFQNVSVFVSILTLTFIAVDRWYAICNPLHFKSTALCARMSIAGIWLISMIAGFPHIIWSDTIKVLKMKNYEYLTNCVLTWDSSKTIIFTWVTFALFFAAPFLVMSSMYYQIVKVLWKQTIPGSDESQLSDGRKFQIVRTPANKSFVCQLKGRRKAAKMLIAVFAMFGICFLPVHTIEILRSMIIIPTTDTMIAISQFSHWLCYFNSAVNPMIYNFMSEKFRRAFQKTMSCMKSDQQTGRSNIPVEFDSKTQSNQMNCRYMVTVNAPQKQTGVTMTCV